MTGKRDALICDTGALIDYIVVTAPDHELFRDAIESAQARFIPGLVLAEVDYFLRDDRGGMQALMEDVASGAFIYAPPDSGLLARAMQIDRRFADLRLGLVDCSIAALAETLGVRRIATRDLRHFSAIRLRDGSAFELVVMPSDPQRD